MTSIRTLIVDDEKEAREGLELLLSDDPEIELVEICRNGVEAIDALQSSLIDLMFLDIQMPVVDGFEVIASVPQEKLPQIIFTTAYDQYALKAFEVHAVDYLLKPFSDARFREALQRARRLLHSSRVEEQKKLVQVITDRQPTATTEAFSVEGPMNRLVVKDAGKVHFLNLADIVWIEAYDYYVKVHVSDRYYLMRKSMKHLTGVLPPSYFTRVHKSSIINKQYIQSLENVDGELVVELSNHVKLKVGRTYKEGIKDLL